MTVQRPTRIHTVGSGEIDFDGLDFEDDTPETLAEALATLENGLTAWFEEQGIETT